MKRLSVLVVIILFAFCGSAFADTARCECASYTVSLEAFSSPFDQHQEFERLSLELGAQHVVAAVAPTTELPRYLVFVRACDAFVCYIPRARAQQAAPVYEWRIFERPVDAFEELSQHGEAAALGVITMGDGSIVVYWSSTGATAAR
jgi:hypothetical protein